MLSAQVTRRCCVHSRHERRSVSGGEALFGPCVEPSADRRNSAGEFDGINVTELEARFLSGIAVNLFANDGDRNFSFNGELARAAIIAWRHPDMLTKTPGAMTLIGKSRRNGDLR